MILITETGSHLENVPYAEVENEIPRGGRSVWPAGQAEMRIFRTPQREAIFVSQASACQAWALCLAVAKGCVAKYQITFHTGTLYSQRLANTELRFGRNVSVVLNWIFVSQVERERERECWILQVRKDELSVAPIY